MFWSRASVLTDRKMFESKDEDDFAGDASFDEVSDDNASVKTATPFKKTSTLAAGSVRGSLCGVSKNRTRTAGPASVISSVGGGSSSQLPTPTKTKTKKSNECFAGVEQASEVSSLPYKSSVKRSCKLCSISAGSKGVAWFQHEEGKTKLLPIGNLCRICGLSRAVGFPYLTEDELDIKMKDTKTGSAFTMVFNGVRDWVDAQGDDFNVKAWLMQEVGKMRIMTIRCVARYVPWSEAEFHSQTGMTWQEAHRLDKKVQLTSYKNEAFHNSRGVITKAEPFRTLEVISDEAVCVSDCYLGRGSGIDMVREGQGADLAQSLRTKAFDALPGEMKARGGGSCAVMEMNELIRHLNDRKAAGGDPLGGSSDDGGQDGDQKIDDEDSESQDETNSKAETQAGDDRSEAGGKDVHPLIQKHAQKLNFLEIFGGAKKGTQINAAKDQVSKLRAQIGMGRLANDLEKLVKLATAARNWSKSKLRGTKRDVRIQALSIFLSEGIPVPGDVLQLYFEYHKLESFAEILQLVTITDDDAQKLKTSLTTWFVDLDFEMAPPVDNEGTAAKMDPESPVIACLPMDRQPAAYINLVVHEVFLTKAWLVDNRGDSSWRILVICCDLVIPKLMKFIGGSKFLAQQVPSVEDPVGLRDAALLTLKVALALRSLLMPEPLITVPAGVLGSYRSHFWIISQSF